ncbi:MAG TPA: VOC family protein [Actinotalea sp.]|nr:VOC family protein [Actinotalea sp.]
MCGSAAARHLALSPDPTLLQELTVVLEAADPAALAPFWQRASGYVPGTAGSLVDPVRRDPTLRIQPSSDHRPLRHRIHLDVVRPPAQVEQADLGEAYGPCGVCHAGPDGNEVDRWPGWTLGDEAETADWQVVFGAMACYHTTSIQQQGALAAAAAEIARSAGFPLLIDLRAGLVVLDSGKDQCEDGAHDPGLDVVALARELQGAARSLGAVADPGLPRFVQVFFDAADVPGLRSFWMAALGYSPDPRPGLTDIVDPRRLAPELLFQELDASDTARRRQRNRFRLELAVPGGVAPSRGQAIVAPGGSLLDRSGDRWHLTDPEGNELAVVGGARPRVRS